MSPTTTTASRLPARGIYAPTLTFYKEDNDSIDLETTVAHALRLARAGLAGLVIMGSNGEAPLVEPEERRAIVAAIRAALNEEGLQNANLIVGTGAQSLKVTLKQTQDAAQAGADFALVLPPSYWPPAMTKPVLHAFFDQVCQQSPIPVLAYNFPLVAGGINLTSDDLIDLARRQPNLVGAKLTCGNLGTLQRTASALTSERFAVLGGRSEFVLHGLIGGSHGTIGALVNVAPATHVALYQAYLTGDLIKAQEIQAVVSAADGDVSKLGVAGLKALVCEMAGWDKASAAVRSPLLAATLPASLFEKGSSVATLLQLEARLAKPIPL